MESELVVLSNKEQGDLTSLESKIDSGLGTFIDVGQALMAIRDRLLYRETADTFEDYVRDRFDMSRRRAYQQIDAAAVGGVVCNLLHIPPPARESHVRPLVRLKDEQLQKTAWALSYRKAPKINGKPRVTESVVEAVVAGLPIEKPGKPPKPSKPAAVKKDRKQAMQAVGVLSRWLSKRPEVDKKFGKYISELKEIIKSS